MARERNDRLALHFGDNLRACRRHVRLSQEELAARAGLHRTEIGLLEGGGRVPSIETLLRVAAGVEASEARLLTGIDWVPSVERGRMGAFVFSAPLSPSMLWRIGGEDG